MIQTQLRNAFVSLITGVTVFYQVSTSFRCEATSAFVGDETYDDYDDESTGDQRADWQQQQDQELETSQQERREGASKAAMIAIGEHAAWNTIGVRWMEWVEENHAWSGALGTGIFDSTAQSGSLAVRVRSQNVGARYQYWPSSVFPLALAGDAGLHKWTVRASCSTAASTDVCSEGTLNGLGLSVSAGLLISWLADDGVFLEWLVLGGKWTSIVQRSWSGVAGAMSEAEASNALTKKRLMNFANVAVGWRF